MKSWLPQLIILLFGLFWVVWTVYRRQLLNKAVWIKTINPAVLQSVGDIKVNQHLLEIKFTWTVKKFLFRQITQIRAYSQTNLGFEEYEQIDILFNTGDKISFNGSLAAHREIVQIIASEIGIKNKDLGWGFLPFLGDSMGRDIVYKRTKEFDSSKSGDL